MATLTIDPVNRIEGHLKVTMTVNNDNSISDAKCTGNLFRGFELIMNNRDPRDAPQITQRICGVCPTSHVVTSSKCLETALGLVVDPGTSNGDGDIPNYSTVIPPNGQIIQNIIQGCDLVMSHITHLYHLSALDFINTTGNSSGGTTGGFPNMAPWLPSYTATDMLTTGSGQVGSQLVVDYVTALAMRRKMHTAGALFSGRQPMANAVVPGGVTTMLTQSSWPLTPQTGTDYDQFGPYNFSDIKVKFTTLLGTVRQFINETYIPDVCYVATSYGFGTLPFTQGHGLRRYLAYGDYPQPFSTAGTLAIKRGIVDATSGSLPGSLTLFDQARIRENVDNSYYSPPVLDPVYYPKGRHPFDGVTAPSMTSGYSWLKAPRYLDSDDDQTATALVCEVGPLARVLATHLSTTQLHASDADVAGGGVKGGANYTMSDLITAALGLIGGGAVATHLLGTLGRHAARALEAKYIADLMASTRSDSWINQIVPADSCYTYRKLPKQIATGYGLTEAPRGALGHWIKIEGKKVAKYQCVVPTTWNGSPGGGAIEQALTSTVVNDHTSVSQTVVDVLRVIHSFDICIACAVHVMNPEGKEMLKFVIDPDGRPTDITVSE